MRLKARERRQLEFIDHLKGPVPKLLLDTTVYIDELQGRLPNDVEIALRAAEIWHSTVTEAELAALAGLLEPKRSQTAQAVRQVAASIAKRPHHRILNPDSKAWREAGILAGTLARLQQYGKSERQRAVADALIYLSAANNGCAVLTRNIADFDFLQQLAPFGRVLFYERTS